jgi:alkaline phosphatase D
VNINKYFWSLLLSITFRFICALFILEFVLISCFIVLDSQAFVPELQISNGVASGDVDSTSAVIWSRSNVPAWMNVDFDTDPKFHNFTTQSVHVNSSSDFTGHIKLTSLMPDTIYYYRVWFSVHYGDSRISVAHLTENNSTTYTHGSFRTAPKSDAVKSFNFVTGGDLGGQGYCRRDMIGYPIFSIMKDLVPEFFIFNGDQIYADSSCSIKPPLNVIGWKNIPKVTTSIEDQSIDWTNYSEVHDVYLKHWEYNREDHHLKDLLGNTSMYSQPDDHEVLDNYGRNWEYGYNKSREGFPNLVKAGLDLFFKFSPIGKSMNENHHMYRYFNWGKGMDLFLLDWRSYRDRNDIISYHNKTILGEDQMKWLEAGLRDSNSTWKVISIPSPISIGSCNNLTGCDNWATDGHSQMSFTEERSRFLKFLDDNNIKNVVFLATDVHFPYIAKITEDFNGDGKNLTLHEIVNGPLNAIPAGIKFFKVDPTINMSLIYNESAIFNFAHVRIYQNATDNEIHLSSEIIDSNGIVRPGSRMDIKPQYGSGG